jgi:hypothetical protein
MGHAFLAPSRARQEGLRVAAEETRAEVNFEVVKRLAERTE